MNNSENIIQNNNECFEEKPKLSKLALSAIALAAMGPMSAGAMWIGSFNDFPAIANPQAVAIFSCGPAWILAVLFGTRALKVICQSQGRLIGREYAMGAIVISAVWMILVLVALLMPALFSINS